jgi:hypothetical protein
MKPGIGLSVTEADVRDLIEFGYLRELGSTSSGVRVKFVVTSAGRAAGQTTPIAVEVNQEGTSLPSPPAAPPLEDVLAWMIALEDRFPSVLARGRLLANQALGDFDEGQLDAVCRRMIWVWRPAAGESSSTASQRPC